MVLGSHTIDSCSSYRGFVDFFECFFICCMLLEPFQRLKIIFICFVGDLFVELVAL